MSLASLLNDPKHWQDRAAQAEALADQIADVVGKATALSIAEDYARLGRRAEKRPLVRLGGAETGERQQPGRGRAIREPGRAGRPAGALGPLDHADHLSGRCGDRRHRRLPDRLVLQEAGSKARHTAENLARALEGDIARNVEARTIRPCIG